MSDWETCDRPADWCGHVTHRREKGRVHWQGLVEKRPEGLPEIWEVLYCETCGQIGKPYPHDWGDGNPCPGRAKTHQYEWRGTRFAR